MHPTAPRPILSLTPAAAARVRELRAQRGLSADYGLRLYVADGGCAGYRYGLRLEAQPQTEDTVVETQGVRVFVDPISLLHVRGSVIDYVDDWLHSGFTIHNPNVIHTCGCGNSFRTAAAATPQPTAHSCQCRA